MTRFTIPLVVQGDELDRSAAVDLAQALRYFERARWRAWFDRSGGVGRLDGLHKIVVRTQAAVVRDRISLDAGLTVDVGVARVGKTSLTFGQFMRDASGRTVAKARLVAVHINADGRPLQVPDRLRARIDPELAAEDPELDDLPAADVDASEVSSHSVTVRPSQTDLFRHINHAAYVELFEDTRVLSNYPTESATVARACHVEYLRESRLGERLRVVVGKSHGGGVTCQLLADNETHPRCRAWLGHFKEQ